jgi:hypothetical protein
VASATTQIADGAATTCPRGAARPSSTARQISDSTWSSSSE